MKLFLCLMIVILSSYIGRLMAKKTVLRLEYFREYNAAMIYLTDKVVGLRLELAKALSERKDHDIFRFFNACANMVRRTPQTSFAVIWKRSYKAHSKETSFLNKEDLGVIMEGGNAIETLCKNPSERQAEAYLKRLASYLSEMEVEQRKKSKLFNTSGVLAGLFIALLVI